MKYLLFVLFLIINPLITLSQEDENLSILSTNNWGKEIIKFPIDWAPKVELTGFEELRFSPFWSDPNNDQFWSLIMAWKINTNSRLTLIEIEKNFEGYFEGLMIPNHWKTTFPRPNALFLLRENSSEKIIGKMRLFDGFHTGKMIDLNITVNQYFLQEDGKSILVFRISPKNFKHPIWELLRSIKRKP
ncbi:hypothetical protein [Tenacibaculum xiamenense]|uniref:hypothetical protein n=1 Tax=Tenacibaculum xiamenense TaxID=1261553 RepID=UPI003893E142